MGRVVTLAHDHRVVVLEAGYIRCACGWSARRRDFGLAYTAHCLHLIAAFQGHEPGPATPEPEAAR